MLLRRSVRICALLLLMELIHAAPQIFSGGLLSFFVCRGCKIALTVRCTSLLCAGRFNLCACTGVCRLCVLSSRPLYHDSIALLI